MTNQTTRDTDPIDPFEWQAYLDDELEADARARIDAAIAADPALADRLARDRRLRGRVRDAFSEVLDEPVPARFEALLSAPMSQAGPADRIDDAVVPMRASTTSREPVRRQGASRWQGMAGYALAAVLAVVAIGGWWKQAQVPVRFDAGGPVASGELARGLDHVLASAPDPASSVVIGLSFRDGDAHVCRSFAYRRDTTLAGLACRVDGAWRVTALERIANSGEGDGGWRQASSAMSPALQAAIDAALVGEAFDADAERAARDSGWR